MKRSIYLVLLFVLFQCSIFAQVPNGGFESWTSGSPDGWLANNAPGAFNTITQSNSSYAGSSAVKGQVENYMGTNYPPILISINIQGAGFPISLKYNSLKGYFKYNPVGGDILTAEVVVTLEGSPIGIGVYESSSPLNDYTEVNVPIEYFLTGTPDTAIIYFTILGPNGDDYHVGSEFYADEISLSEAVVGVNDVRQTPLSFNLEQNYPNPFNPSTSINYQIPERSFVSMKVYNILGNEVAHLINETKEAGTYTINFDASSLSSGVYIYSINAGSFSSSKKMILTK